MDYRGLGFRECLAETARYLSIMEGLDSTDPLRLRLVSHLSSYASQREAHSGLSHLAWGSAFATPPPPPAHLAHPLLLQQQQQQVGGGALPSLAPRSATSSPHTPLSSPPSSSSCSAASSPSSEAPPPGRRSRSATPHSDHAPHRVPPPAAVTALHPALVSAAAKLSPPLISPLSAFPFSLGAFPLLAPAAAAAAISPPGGSSSSSNSSVAKPYRPWGLEIGAF